MVACEESSPAASFSPPFPFFLIAAQMAMIRFLFLFFFLKRLGLRPPPPLFFVGGGGAKTNKL